MDMKEKKNVFTLIYLEYPSQVDVKANNTNILWWQYFLFCKQHSYAHNDQDKYFVTESTYLICNIIYISSSFFLCINPIWWFLLIFNTKDTWILWKPKVKFRWKVLCTDKMNFLFSQYLALSENPDFIAFYLLIFWINSKIFFSFVSSRSYFFWLCKQHVFNF